MRIVDRTALVPFSAQAMFNLVRDVEAYPEFLPWCPATTLQNLSENELEASLKLGFASLNSEFTTRNHFVEPDWMSMELLDGPFSSLEGRWVFDSLGEEGCEVRLHVEFEFASRINDALLGAAFETICAELIDAFVKRAHQLYD